jgi:predicted transcriptional regulator
MQTYKYEYNEIFLEDIGGLQTWISYSILVEDIAYWRHTNMDTIPYILFEDIRSIQTWIYPLN